MPRVPRGAGCSAVDRVTRSVTRTQQQQKHISLSHFQDSFFLFHSPPFITAQFRSGIVDWEEVEATKEKKKKRDAGALFNFESDKKQTETVRV